MLCGNELLIDDKRRELRVDLATDLLAKSFGMRPDELTLRRGRNLVLQLRMQRHRRVTVPIPGVRCNEVQSHAVV